MVNTQLLEAKQAPAILENDGKNGKVLIRKAMIDYFTDISKGIDDCLAIIPKILDKYQLSEYNKESVHRAIIVDGFAAVRKAVQNRTRDNLKQSGLFPQIVDRLARENADCLPQECKDEIEGLVREIADYNGILAGVGLGVQLDNLWFKSGKLRIPPKNNAAIAPKFTLPVPDKHLKVVDKIREAAKLLAELNDCGVPISDEMRLSVPDNKPFLAPGLMRRMVDGASYSDAELLGLLQGIQLTR